RIIAGQVDRCRVQGRDVLAAEIASPQRREDIRTGRSPPARRQLADERVEGATRRPVIALAQLQLAQESQVTHEARVPGGFIPETGLEGHDHTTSPDRPREWKFLGPALARVAAVVEEVEGLEWTAESGDEGRPL